MDRGRLGDNNKDCRIVMKSSRDGGLSWSPMQFLSPEHRTSYSNGGGLYDRVRDRVLVQYEFIPAGSTRPVVNATYYQIVSSDDGRSWSKPVDITEQLSGCNPDRDNMMQLSEGSKIQTDSGIIVDG